MPKISLDNLERYDGHLKDWCDARFAESKVHENWHEAGPSSAVSFYPVPDSPIDPVVNFAFTETLPEGTKGSDNPSTITGVSSITVTRCETVGVDSTDYTIALGDTYYAVSVDLSTGIMTVTHVMVEPDSLSFDISAHPANADNFQYADTFGRTITTDGNTLTITGDTGGQIAYNLATPETISLTSVQIHSLSQSDPYTLRINTVYSDQQSVLVRYPKSPIITGSELDNAILSLGGD